MRQILKSWRTPLLILLTLIPFFSIASYTYFQLQELDQLQERIARAQRKDALIQQQKIKEIAWLRQLEQVDPLYIDKQLQTLTFLEPEIKYLQALAFKGEQAQGDKERLHFLETANRLTFSQTQVRRSDLLREIEYNQSHAIEMNGEDLKRLLSLIEGVAIPPFPAPSRHPQIFFRMFELTKKRLTPQQQVFLVNTEIVQREKISP